MLLTVAIDSSLDVHVHFDEISDAPVCLPLVYVPRRAVNLPFLPVATLRLVDERYSLYVTTSVTVTLYVTLYPLYVAVMTAVPLETPVTIPLETVTTDSSLDDHSAYAVTSVFWSRVPSTMR